FDFVNRPTGELQSFRMRHRWLRERLSQPATAELRPAETFDEIRTGAHHAPEKIRAMVLDHEHDWSLIDAVVPGRKPTTVAAALIRESRIERGLQSVRMLGADLDFVEMLQRRQDDFRSEGQRGND